MLHDLDGNGWNVLARALTRAAVDLEFRRRLLLEPHKAVAEATGIVLPAEFRLRFMEAPADVDALIVLPRMIEVPVKDSE